MVYRHKDPTGHSVALWATTCGSRGIPPFPGPCESMYLSCDHKEDEGRSLSLSLSGTGIVPRGREREREKHDIRAITVGQI